MSVTAVDLTKSEFDSICVIVIHHYCDTCFWAKQGKNDKKLVAKAIKALGIDEHEALAIYDTYIEMWGRQWLPERYMPTWDTWGARCFSCLQHETPRLGWFAGDECGRWLWVESHEALEDYTNAILKRIEEGEEA